MKIPLQIVKNIGVKFTKRVLYEYKNLLHHYPLISLIIIMLVIISSFSLSAAIQNTVMQKQLANLITAQNTQLNELIKNKKEEVLVQKNSGNEKDNTIKELTNVLKTLINIKNDSSVMGVNTMPSPISSSTIPTASIAPALMGLVRTNSNNNTSIPVYEQPVIPGNIIGTVAANKFLFYYQKQPSWYKVELEAGKYGWIQQDFLIEI